MINSHIVAELAAEAYLLAQERDVALADMRKALATRAALIDALERIMDWAAPIAGDSFDEIGAAEEIASIEQARDALTAAKD